LESEEFFPPSFPEMHSSRFLMFRFRLCFRTIILTSLCLVFSSLLQKCLPRSFSFPLTLRHFHLPKLMPDRAVLLCFPAFFLFLPFTPLSISDFDQYLCLPLCGPCWCSPFLILNDDFRICKCLFAAFPSPRHFFQRGLSDLSPESMFRQFSCAFPRPEVGT